MTGNNPTDRSKLGQAKRHILTDKKGIPLSAIISSAKTHDIKLVTADVIDNVVIRRPSSKYRNKRIRIIIRQHSSIYVLIKDIILKMKNKN